MPLFRTESEAARADSWLGRILLIRPASFTVLTAAALVMALSLGAFFIVAEYTRKARVAGVLAPEGGVVKVVAPQAGTVQIVHTHEGAVIDKDATVLTLADSRVSVSREDFGEAIVARLGERRRALQFQHDHAMAALQSEQAGLAQRRSGLARELSHLDGELRVHADRLALARQGLGRSQRLEGTGFVSAAALDREREQALDQESRLEAMRRTRMGLARELTAVELDAGTARSRANAQIAAIASQRAALAQERVERESQFRSAIVAPTAGTVATVLADPGQAIAPGTTIATIIPAGAPLEAHLYAPSRSIGFVRMGQEVLLRYLAYPHQKFGTHRARVTAIARNPMSPAELGFTPPDGSREPLYRIKVELASQSIDAYGREEPLHAGMAVEADILLDRRRLIEWVFEPLLSLAGRT